MSPFLSVEVAERYGIAARFGHQPKEEDLRQFGPVRPWPIIRDDGSINLDQLVLPLTARKPWVWQAQGDPWALAPKAVDLIVAVCASSGACHGRALFLLETAQIDRFLVWKHAIMREGRAALIAYLASEAFGRSSEARAALDPPMNDPDPPTPQVRRLYDGAIAYAEKIGVVWPGRGFTGGSLPECHWQSWPIKHVLIAGVCGEWDR